MQITIHSHKLFAADSIFSNAKGKKESQNGECIWYAWYCSQKASSTQAFPQASIPESFSNSSLWQENPGGAAKFPSSAWAPPPSGLEGNLDGSAFWLALFPTAPPPSVMEAC